MQFTPHQGKTGDAFTPFFAIYPRFETLHRYYAIGLGDNTDYTVYSSIYEVRRGAATFVSQQLGGGGIRVPQLCRGWHRFHQLGLLIPRGEWTPRTSCIFWVIRSESATQCSPLTKPVPDRVCGPFWHFKNPCII